MMYKNLILICFCLLFAACPPIDYKHFFIFCNNSDDEVYVYLEPAPKEVYLDTISKPQHLIFGPIKKYITNKDRRGISFNLFPEQGDTIYIFVLADIDTLPEKCRVLQRYNLSINMDELKNRGGIISFPPTEEMKHVRMYPPYGTYNEEK